MYTSTLTYTFVGDTTSFNWTGGHYKSKTNCNYTVSGSIYTVTPIDDSQPFTISFEGYGNYDSMNGILSGFTVPSWGTSPDITQIPQKFMLGGGTITGLNNPQIVIIRYPLTTEMGYIATFDLVKETSLLLNHSNSSTMTSTHYDSLNAGGFSITNITSTSLTLNGVTGSTLVAIW